MLCTLVIQLAISVSDIIYYIQKHLPNIEYMYIGLMFKRANAKVYNSRQSIEDNLILFFCAHMIYM